MSNKLLIIVFSIILAALLYKLNDLFPGAIHGKENYASIAISLFMIISLLLGVFKSDISGRRVLTGALAWLAVIIVILISYSYRYEAKQIYYRVMGNVVPSLVQTNTDGSVVIYGGQGGHFIAMAQVDGVNVRFLVDTGASSVVLTPQDAHAIGIDVDSLKYNILVETANGATFTAPVLISQLQLGDIVIRDVKASVSKDNLDISLLGMSFLTRLKGYAVDQGKLTMYQ